jgi:hypothetical protein
MVTLEAITWLRSAAMLRLSAATLLHPHGCPTSRMVTLVRAATSRPMQQRRQSRFARRFHFA